MIYADWSGGEDGTEASTPSMNAGLGAQAGLNPLGIDGAFCESVVGWSDGLEYVRRRHGNIYLSAVGRDVGRLGVLIEAANERIKVLAAKRAALERHLERTAYLVESFKGFYSLSLLDRFDIGMKLGTSLMLVAATYFVQRKVLELSSLFTDADVGAAVTTLLTLGAFFAKGLYEQTGSPELRRKLMFGFTFCGLTGSIAASLLAITAFVITNALGEGEGVTVVAGLQAALLVVLAFAEPAGAAALYIAGKQKLRDAREVEPKTPKDRETIEDWLKEIANSLVEEQLNVSNARAELAAYTRGESLFIQSAEVDFQARCARRKNEQAAQKYLAGLLETLPFEQAMSLVKGFVTGGNKPTTK